MAQEVNEIENKEKKDKVEATSQESERTNLSEVSEPKQHDSRHGLAIVLAVLAAAFFALFMMACAANFWFNRFDHRIEVGNKPFMRGFDNDDFGRNGFGRRRMMGDVYGGMHSNNNQQISGVVTALNGQTFTVAGNGKTNTITTTSSTEYINGTKIKVNDSVLVTGTTSNSTFIATTIYVNPGSKVL